MGIIALNNELTDELRFSLPSSNMYKYPSVLAVKHPNDKDLIILKTRYKWIDTLKLTEDQFESYSEKHGWQHEYSELVSRLIIVESNVLNHRGKAVLDGLR